jgi:hypothetical protein
MENNQVSTTIKSVVIVFCICFSINNAKAEYYIVYSAPQRVSCEFCFTKQKPKTHVKKITYHDHTNCSHIKTNPVAKKTPHFAKTKSVRQYHVPSLIQGEYNLDFTTGDDNPYVEPDMNIDY